MDHIQVEVPDLYPWVMASASLIAFQCVIIGFMAGGKRKFFDKELLKEKFGEEHQKEFGRDLPKGGYPDHGDGRYGQASLTYKQWV